MTRIILLLAGLLYAAQVLSAESDIEAVQVKREQTPGAGQDQQGLSSRDAHDNTYLESQIQAVEENLNRRLDQLQEANTQRFNENISAAATARERIADRVTERVSSLHIVGFFIVTSVLSLLAFIGYTRFAGIAETFIADHIVRNLKKGGFEEKILVQASAEIDRLVAHAEKEVKEKLQAVDDLALDYETQLLEVQKDQRLLSEIRPESIEAEHYKMKLARFEETITQFKTERRFTAVDWFLKGAKQNCDGDYQEAIESLDKAIELDPDHADAYNNRGISYEELGDPQRAIDDYSKAIELDPDYAMAYNNRGNSYDDLGEGHRAINDYDRAIELGPDCAMAYSNRGVRYAALGEDQKAINDYDRAIELDPDNTDAYNNRGNRYAALGQDQQAIDDYNRAIELDPDYTDAYHNRGVRYATLGEDQKAINDYSIAIELDPGFSDAYTNRGNRYAALGEDQKAIDDYSLAIELDPDDSDAYGNRGVRYAALGEDQKAIDDYDKAIELDPEYSDAYNNRGNRYAALGEDQKAIADYNKAIELDPDYAGTFLNLTELYVIIGDFDHGIQILQKTPMGRTDRSTQAVFYYLQVVLHELQDQDASRFEVQLMDALAEKPKLTWSFDALDNWIKTAAISEEKKISLHVMTQLMKKCN